MNRVIVFEQVQIQILTSFFSSSGNQWPNNKKVICYLLQISNTTRVSWAIRTNTGECKARVSDYDVEFGLSYFYKYKESYYYFPLKILVLCPHICTWQHSINLLYLMLLSKLMYTAWLCN